jgi:apolipoprotein D and lipocalin family protein
VGRALVESLKNSTVVHSPAARETFRIEPTPLGAAFLKAIDEGASMRLKQDSRRIVVNAPPADAFAPIRRIGGRSGWYFGNMLWHARGWIDRCIGGVGMARGRRDSESCRVGDVVDGWTVDAYEPDRCLRLAADLKMPGHATLEFQVTPLDDGRQSEIRQTASFDPRGLLGQAYWRGLQPFHSLVFRGMLRNIARRAEAVGASTAQPRLPENRMFRLLGISVLAGIIGHPESPSTMVRSVEKVDLGRYVGEWFEIARFPNRFQRRCAGDVRATYAMRADGRIDVVNQCRAADGSLAEARGVARVVDERSAKLKVRFAPAVLSFLPFVWGDYWILGLAEDYSWAVVGSPDRGYLWVLSRTPTLDPARYAAALAAARGNGFDVMRLTKTSQAGRGHDRP